MCVCVSVGVCVCKWRTYRGPASCTKPASSVIKFCSGNGASYMAWLCRQCTSVQDKVFNALSTRTTLIWMPEEKNRIKASAETFQSSEERHAKKVKDYS